MTMSTPSLLIVGTLLALGFNIAPAHAQLSRTFVSAATGNDANNCDRPTPCRTFQTAHNKTNDLGEITVLDPGGYGTVTITKSISLVNDGVGEASILVSGDSVGITIAAGSASYINLRGITVQGIGFGGGEGLRFQKAYSLTITYCVFRNHTGAGLDIPAINLGKSPFNLAITDTLIADNGVDGIGLSANDSGVKVVLTRVGVHNNSQNGITVSAFNAGVNVAVQDSIVSNSGGDGITAFTGLGGLVDLMVIRSTTAGNRGAGVSAFGSSLANVRVGQSTVTGNEMSWATANGGTVSSYGDNYIDGNNDGNPAPPFIFRK